MFFKQIHYRIKITLLIIILLFLVIIGKVFYIQVFSYKKINKYANNLWSRNLPIEADRGKIYTVDGEIVAGNLTTTSLVFIPNQIKDKNLDFYLFAATDILNANSKIIALGNKANTVEKAFGVNLENNTAMLNNVVSRKKQMLPNILNNLD